MKDPIRVGVVDDQALMVTGFRMILESADGIEVVGTATNGVEAIDLVARLQPDVVLMDIRMPEMDGVEATRRIMSTPEATTRVLILTTFDLDEYVYSALRAGAAGFLLKDAPPESLIEAVQVVAGGEALLAPSVTRRLVEEFVMNGSALAAAPGIDDLTKRETDVLRAMARGMSNAEIAEYLYVGETTVKTHVGRVLMKLGLRDRVQAVVAAYESGLVQPGQS
ncbi:MAG: response regulator transcription factor [Actinomycetia bacterium]|nr:response regulator transcription factor [Actinomycetes bacterium]MCP4224774.1 response regulator transcription factor [Actinomycetes bacterium]